MAYILYKNVKKKESFFFESVEAYTFGRRHSNSYGNLGEYKHSLASRGSEKLTMGEGN